MACFIYFWTVFGSWFFSQVYGDGKQTRSFQYVDDLVDGLIALMESNTTAPVNLGNPEEHSIEEFASIIKDLVGKFYMLHSQSSLFYFHLLTFSKLSGSNSEVVQKQSQEDDPRQRKPDIRRAAELLNWRPKVFMLLRVFFLIQEFII